MLKHSLALAAVLAAFPALAAEPDPFTGREFKVDAKTISDGGLACVFVQDGTALSGGCGPADHSHAPHPITGTFDGKNITWSMGASMMGKPMTLVYTGVLDANGRITGTQSTSLRPEAKVPFSIGKTPVAGAGGPPPLGGGEWKFGEGGLGAGPGAPKGDGGLACAFTRSGNSVAGGCGPADHSHAPHPIIGTFDGQTLTWVMKATVMGSASTISFVGNLDAAGNFNGTQTYVENRLAVPATLRVVR